MTTFKICPKSRRRYWPGASSRQEGKDWVIKVGSFGGPQGSGWFGTRDI